MIFIDLKQIYIPDRPVIGLIESDFVGMKSSSPLYSSLVYKEKKNLILLL